MTRLRRALLVSSTACWLAVVLVAGLQQRLCPLFPPAFWRKAAHVFPSLAFGYVMFDRIPTTLVYRRISLNGRAVEPAELDHNGSLGYANSRFQLNVLFDPEYPSEVCRYSDRDFLIERVERQLSQHTERVTQRLSCRHKQLEVAR